MGLSIFTTSTNDISSTEDIVTDVRFRYLREVYHDASGQKHYGKMTLQYAISALDKYSIGQSQAMAREGEWTNITIAEIEVAEPISILGEE